MKIKTAETQIEKHGVLLVFPIDNAKLPLSLWSALYPRSKMRWEWDENGDGRVADLWRLREHLSRSGNVIYSKWYKGRATFFSREVFTAMMCVMQHRALPPEVQNPKPIRDQTRIRLAAGELLEQLEMESPLSTKQLKAATDLRGRENERVFQRAMGELWEQLLIVGYGEIDDGAFPSLAVARTRHFFETETLHARTMTEAAAWEIITRAMPNDSPFRQYFERLLKKPFLFRPPHGLA